MAQALVVVGLVSATDPVGLLREFASAVLIPFAMRAEAIVRCALVVLTGCGDMMPSWAYPAWLRPQRCADRERFRKR